MEINLASNLLIIIKSISSSILCLGALGGVANLYLVWKRRSRIKIYSIDFDPYRLPWQIEDSIQYTDFISKHLKITLQNIGADEDSITQVNATGLRFSQKKEFTGSYEIETSQRLIPHEKISIIAGPNNEKIRLIWFVTIKINFANSKSKKVRLRQLGKWPEEKISIVRFMYERFFFRYYHYFYIKHMYSNKIND